MRRFRRATPELVKELEKVLGGKLPENCQIDISVRDLDADTEGFAPSFTLQPGEEAYLEAMSETLATKQKDIEGTVRRQSRALRNQRMR